jgi:hypothetical protein
LKEPAPWFFILLDQGFKIDAEEKAKLVEIAAVAQMDSPAIQNLQKKYINASREILDILKDDDDYSAISKLKQEMSSDG